MKIIHVMRTFPWAVAWRATRISLEIEGAFAIFVWFASGHMPVLITIASALQVVSVWAITFKLYTAMQSRKVLVAPRRTDSKHRESGSVPPSSEGRRRLVRMDPDTGDPVFKLELPGEA